MFPEHLATFEDSVLTMQTATCILVENTIDIASQLNPETSVNQLILELLCILHLIYIFPHQNFCVVSKREHERFKIKWDTCLVTVVLFCRMILIFFFLARSSMVKTVSAEVFHLGNLLLGDSDNKLEELR